MSKKEREPLSRLVIPAEAYWTPGVAMEDRTSLVFEALLNLPRVVVDPTQITSDKVEET